MFLLGIDLRANQRAIGCSHNHRTTVTPVENIVLQVAFSIQNVQLDLMSFLPQPPT